MVTRIYANAVAKYNEGKLLSAEKFRRLMDADFADAVKMLADYGYGGGTVDESSYDVDAFISSETANLIDYVLSSAPDEYLARILTNRFLYGNAKAYYKARVCGKSNAAAIYKMPDEEVRTGIEKGDYAALPQCMADALSQLDILFSESKPDPKEVDIFLTRAMYADSLLCAKKSKSKTMRNYVIAEIDLNNVTAALRARALKMPEAELKRIYIAGGVVPQDDVLAIYASDNPARVIKDTPYDELTENNEALDLPRIEAFIDDYLTQIWQQDTENMQSLSPFVGYFLAQLCEYKTVKLILTCLKNNVREAIAPRLRQPLRG